jgi:release factor glutamine methyltransferase
MALNPTSPSATHDSLLENLVNAFQQQWPHLPDKPEENATSGIRALWFAAAGQPCSVQKASEGALPGLTSPQRENLQALIERRLTGVPLAHLVGWQRFMGIELKSGPQALIPRKETEILGNAALKELRNLVAERGTANVIDVCTGSGNLAISLAAHEKACRITAADLCESAVLLARENAKVHNVSSRVEFRTGDLFAPFGNEFDGAIDLLVCNPPYLSSAKLNVLPREIAEHEPKEAFDAGSFGLAIISRLISEAPRFLKPKSVLCFEVGLGQGPFFATRLERNGSYAKVETACDEAGEVRALIARTP